jgi:hypothetical protein
MPDSKYDIDDIMIEIMKELKIGQWIRVDYSKKSNITKKNSFMKAD